MTHSGGDEVVNDDENPSCSTFIQKESVPRFTVWSEGFLYKVAPPEVKISPSMYFSIYNGLVQNSQNHCAISVKFLKNNFLLYKID